MKKNPKILLALILALALLLTGCPGGAGGNSAGPVPNPNGPTAPPDGDPNNATCQGSYSVTDAEAAAAGDQVVATLGSATLTNAQLQTYYGMAVAAYSGEIMPDFAQPLDVQMCGIDGVEGTWQQYFLSLALSTWQNRQSLALLVQETQDENWNTFLAALPELTGGDEALLDYAVLLNQSYLAFSQNYQSLNPTEEELAQLLEANPGEPIVTVDIRHIFLAAGTDPQPILDKFLAEGGREDDFALQATENSLDAGTCHNGGLYQGIRQGWLMPELDAWCFDAARQKGDYTVIKTHLGVHILWFRGSGDARPEVLWAEITTGRMTELLAGVENTMTVNYSAIVLAPVKTYDLTDGALLYPDPEQENYPEMPLMIQQDYPYAYYGPGRTVDSHGCGLTCFAMVATYLLDEEQSPEDLGPRFASYSAPEGTARSLFNEGPAAMGFGLVKMTSSDEEALTALREGHVVVSLQKVGLFTNGGHYLVLAKYQEDGKIKVLDPNKYNYVRNSIREDGFANGFEEKYITPGGYLYWIYEKKTLSDPACTYCGDGDTAGIFAEDYYCADCRELMPRRWQFLDYCG